MEEDDPFRDADEQLVGLINDVMPQNSCSPQEYVNGEDTIPVCKMQRGRKTFWDG